MSDISTQQKLQLARQVRERYQQDRQDLGQREQLLYGRTLSYFEEDPYTTYGETSDYRGQYGNMNGRDPTAGGTLGLRILLAAILVCLLALADHRGDTFFGLTSGQILDYISWDCTP